MSISKLYESGIQKRNLLHFAAIVNMALVDGNINEAEQKMLTVFAKKFNIREEQFNEVVNNISNYPFPCVSSIKERFEYIYELFCIIYADHEIDGPEMHLVHKYAISLGFTELVAKDLITVSIKIFSGKISFDEYSLFVQLLSS